MSGSGKTYWSKQLANLGFKHICCDDLIEEKLKNELKGWGYSGINDIARWMGQPYDSQYKHTSKKYLNFEKQVMDEIFNSIEMNANKDNKIVIDTTGSIIYTGKNILKKLKKYTKVIYLHVSSEIIKELHDLYIFDPKPVIWGNLFNKDNSETDKEALARCYPQLLSYRTKEYQKIADITLDRRLIRTNAISLVDMIKF